MNALTNNIPINKIEKIWISNTTFFIEGLAYLLLLDQNFDERTLSNNMYAMHVWNNTFRKTDLYQQGKNVNNSILQHLIDKYQDFM